MSNISTHPTAMLSAPDWVNRFYSKFPLVVLESEDSVDWKNATPVGRGKDYTLWVSMRASRDTHEHVGPWRRAWHCV